MSQKPYPKWPVFRRSLVAAFQRSLTLIDPDITEVMVNAGGRRIFVERGGVVDPVPSRTVDEKLLTVAIKNIARTCGDEISEEEPILDARLEDGSRVAAMFPPCSVGGATLTIRRFSRRYSLDDLVDVGSVPLDAAVLRDARDSA